VAEDLYTIPQGLIPPAGKKRRLLLGKDHPSFHPPAPRGTKKKAPTVFTLFGFV
jgi:hypothetical protein